jgi:hypothetical protein
LGQIFGGARLRRTMNQETRFDTLNLEAVSARRDPSLPIMT